MLSGATSSEAQQTNAQNQKFILAPRCAAGTKVGVVGLGGLGHLALQFAAKLGAEVSLLSRPGVYHTGAHSLRHQCLVKLSLSCDHRPSLCSRLPSACTSF